MHTNACTPPRHTYARAWGRTPTHTHRHTHTAGASSEAPTQARIHTASPHPAQKDVHAPKQKCPRARIHTHLEGHNVGGCILLLLGEQHGAVHAADAVLVRAGVVEGAADEERREPPVGEVVGPDLAVLAKELKNVLCSVEAKEKKRLVCVRLPNVLSVCAGATRARCPKPTPSNMAQTPDACAHAQQNRMHRACAHSIHTRIRISRTQPDCTHGVTCTARIHMHIRTSRTLLRSMLRAFTPRARIGVGILVQDSHAAYTPRARWPSRCCGGHTSRSC